MDNPSNEELRARLREAEETIEAIRSGEVDAIVMGDAAYRHVYTLDNADRPYRELVEQMQEGALMISGEGMILYANQRAGEILDINPGQLTGKPLLSCIPVSCRDIVQRNFDSSAIAACSGEIELAATVGLRSVALSFKSIKTNRADDRIVCAVLSDLTERRQIEARLNQAQKMEAVGQLTGGLAHDFNNLLQAIHGNLELVRRMPADREKVSRWAENGLRAVDRGAKLTAQLLAFSRSQQIELKTVAVSELVEGMADLFARTLGTSIQLRLDLDKNRIDVVADPTQLELAVLNLAINARDAMPDGGVLTISTRVCTLRDDQEVPDGTYVELQVADSGTGMTPEVVARAFEPFFTTKAVGAGTGLGLAQVYGICRQAGGHVRIDSKVGLGTTVSLLLRHGEGYSAVVRPLMDDVQNAVRGSPRILVVDDDEGVRVFVMDALESLGYRVEGADSGMAALDTMNANPPDLVVLDFAMPHLDGAQVAKFARERGFAMPIIFVSGYADTSSLAAVAGPNISLLRKPFTIGSLGEIVASAIASATPHDK